MLIWNGSNFWLLSALCKVNPVLKKGTWKKKKKECEENREEIKDFFFQEEGGDENKLGVEKVVEEKEGQPLHCPP